MQLQLQHVTYLYGAGTTYEKKALDDVSLQLAQGEFAALIGRTGSGKSTLIQQLNGLQKPAAGTVCCDGEDIHAGGFSLKKLRGRVGLVFQYPEYQLFEETILKDAAFGPKNQGFSEEEALEKAKAAMQMAGIPEDQWELSPFELSGGQKRRAAIAGVLAMEPEVLILDEPTAGLDPRGRQELFAQIVRLNRENGITILLVSHSMEDVAEYAGRVIVMEQGRILFDGPPREVFSHVKELESIGLAVPEVTYLMHELAERGIPADAGAITIREAEEEILRLAGL